MIRPGFGSWSFSCRWCSLLRLRRMRRAARLAYLMQPARFKAGSRPQWAGSDRHRHARANHANPVFETTFHKRVVELLRENKVKAEILAYDEIDRLRQSHSDFASWSVQKIGRELNADQVLYVRIEELRLAQKNNPLLIPSVALRLKLIAPRAPAANARLWPDADRERDGREVTCKRQPGENEGRSGSIRDCQVGPRNRLLCRPELSRVRPRAAAAARPDVSGERSTAVRLALLAVIALVIVASSSLLGPTPLSEIFGQRAELILANACATNVPGGGGRRRLGTRRGNLPGALPESLAEPYTLGVASGASLGAAIAMLTGLTGFLGWIPLSVLLAAPGAWGGSGWSIDGPASRRPEYDASALRECAFLT